MKMHSYSFINFEIKEEKLEKYQYFNHFMSSCITKLEMFQNILNDQITKKNMTFNSLLETIF